MSFYFIFVLLFSKIHWCAPAPLHNEKESDADAVPTTASGDPVLNKFLRKAPYRSKTAYGGTDRPQVEYISWQSDPELVRDIASSLPKHEKQISWRKYQEITLSKF